VSVRSEICTDLDKLIEDEKRALVRECFSDVWEELSEEGVEIGMVAEVFIESALKKLVSERGNKEASKLIAHFKQMDEMGFLPERHTLQ